MTATANTQHGSLAEAMAAFKPVIAARYVAIATDLFTEIVAALGPALKGVHNSWKYAKAYSNTLSAYVRRDGHGFDAPASLNMERLEEDAAKYADAVVEAWTGKINAKLGELDRGTVHRMNGHTFRITGTRGGHEVEIEQTIIINVSSRGTVFNQFPARIYVDRKFKSEAAYKKMFTDAAV